MDVVETVGAGVVYVLALATTSGVSRKSTTKTIEELVA